ncbi:hypothetical protein [Citricoccus sp. GCM10030269]|uniref:hypothetical protein n=1 Tax=Citricoccus sp. GCM10030269 TaxID=3273388 RepID=UPI0036190638
MSPKKSPLEMAEFWTRQARTGPRYPEALPWSPHEARGLTAADGAEEEPLPNDLPTDDPVHEALED